MSWAEVYKINSDFINEPLNFNNYVNDIAVFGANSYVMDAMNEGLYKELMSNSLSAYGHTAIHQYLYNRLTDADVDHILRNNARLGQAFNSFYKTDVFAIGDIDEILKNITDEQYNKLELKWQSGIGRYCSEKINQSEWLNKLFGLQASTSEELFNLFLTANESFKVCLANATPYLEGTIPETVFASYIEAVASSTPSTMILINALKGNNKLTEFFNNTVALDKVVNKVESMKAICYNAEGFAAMIGSTTAMQKVVNSQIAMNVITEAITDSTKAEGALNDIKNSLTSIENFANNIPQKELMTAEIIEGKTQIDKTIAAIKKANSKTDILINNIASLMNSVTVRDCILGSDVALTSIAKNLSAMRRFLSKNEWLDVIVSNTKARDIFLNNKNACIAIVENSTMIYKISTNAPWMEKISKSPTAIRAIMKNDHAKKQWIYSSYSQSYRGNVYNTVRAMGVSEGRLGNASAGNLNSFVNHSNYLVFADMGRYDQYGYAKMFHPNKNILYTSQVNNCSSYSSFVSPQILNLVPNAMSIGGCTFEFNDGVARVHVFFNF